MDDFESLRESPVAVSEAPEDLRVNLEPGVTGVDEPDGVRVLLS